VGGGGQLSSAKDLEEISGVLGQLVRRVAYDAAASQLQAMLSYTSKNTPFLKEYVNL